MSISKDPLSKGLRMLLVMGGWGIALLILYYHPVYEFPIALSYLGGLCFSVGLDILLSGENTDKKAPMALIVISACLVVLVIIGDMAPWQLFTGAITGGFLCGLGLTGYMVLNVIGSRGRSAHGK